MIHAGVAFDAQSRNWFGEQSTRKCKIYENRREKLNTINQNHTEITFFGAISIKTHIILILKKTQWISMGKLF